MRAAGGDAVAEHAQVPSCLQHPQSTATHPESPLKNESSRPVANSTVHLRACAWPHQVFLPSIRDVAAAERIGPLELHHAFPAGVRVAQACSNGIACVHRCLLAAG